MGLESKWNGHHLIPRGKANSIGMNELGTKLNTPTFFPDPYEPGMHEELHQAIKGDIGKIQGPWAGTEQELIYAYGRNLSSVSHIKCDLKIPSTGEVLARNVTPKKLTHTWLSGTKNRKSGGSSTCS